MGIVVVGSVAFDSVKTPFGEREQALGGAANYFSMSASLLTRVNLVGVVGQDFPKSHFDFLHTRGVDTEGVQWSPGKTFHWKGQYGFDLNEAHTLKTELNVFAVSPHGYQSIINGLKLCFWPISTPPCSLMF